MRPLRSYIPIICTFIIGVVVSLTLFVIVKNWEQTNQRIEFESRSRGYANAVQGNLNKYLGALNFLGDFLNRSQQVTRQEFTIFTESALSRYPGIQAFSWNPLVMDNERAVYESLARKEGLKTFKFTEKTKEGALVDAAQCQEYVVVYYITPLETNKPALGYNIASETTRLQSIDKAFKTGELTATGRITLVQETSTQFGVLVFFPLYKQGVSLKTSEARLKYRKGLVVEVLRIGDVVEAALKDFPDEGINLYLYDASAKKGTRLLYARPSRMPGMTEQSMDEEVIQKDIYWSNNFEIAGRQWKILFSPSPFILDSEYYWHSWIILSGSLLLTAILLLYLLKRINYTTEIEWRVREQLRTNQELANENTERKRADKALKEYSERLEEMVKERTRELQDAQQELLRKEKLAAIGLLAGSVGHDLRNPLGVISNSTYYLNMKLKDADEKVKKHLDILQREVRGANNIITDLLDFSRTREPSLAKGDANNILKDVLAEITLPENIALETQLDENLPRIRLDADQIGRVCQNIISNMIQAMPEGGKLKIKTRAGADFIEIIFQDTGKGIPKENLEKIFAPLFSTMANGIGLGLAIVKDLVEGHKGKIEVESEFGKGTRFTVKLPFELTIED